MLIEKEARKLWCPMVGIKNLPNSPFNCLTTGCVMWQEGLTKINCKQLIQNATSTADAKITVLKADKTLSAEDRKLNIKTVKSQLKKAKSRYVPTGYCGLIRCGQ